MGKSLSKILVSLAILFILCAFTQGAESNVIRGEHSNVTGIKVASGQPADALWTDPSYVNLSEVGIGYMFNLTAWVNLTVSSFTWQGELSFNSACFNATRAGYTGGTVSQFFAGHSTIPTSAIIDNVAGTVMLGESLLGADSRGPGSGSLFWTEFMLVAAPSTNLTIDFVGANSYVLDPDLNEIPIPNMYGTNIVISGTTPPPATSVMFVAPSTLAFYTDSTFVGDKFNVTVWVGTPIDTYTWEVKMYFDSSQITAARAGYTGGSTSMFFQGHTTVPITPIIDNSAGYLVLGETLIGTDLRSPGNGSLIWVEFQIVAAPPAGGMLSSTLDINNPETFLLDPNLNVVPTANYGATYSYQSVSPPVSETTVVIIPSVLSFDTSTTSVGDRFNVTVFINCSGSTLAWQVEMLFDPTQIHVARTGLTGLGTSQFFAGHTTVAIMPIIDNTAGQLTEAESLLGNDSRPPGGGSLFWVEFQIVAAPPSGGTLSSVLNISNPETMFIDPTLASIPTTAYNATYSYRSVPVVSQSQFWVIPSVLSFDTSTTSVGDEFNVTVWTNCTVSTFVWQVKMLFDPSQISVVHAGYTAVTTSQFFSGHGTTPVSPFIDNTHGVFMYGESLVDGDSRPPGGGSLFWVEFQIVAAPLAGGTLTSVLGINNPDTYLLDVGLAVVPATMYDATYSYASKVGVVHDVAVIGVTAAPSSVTAGQLVYIGVTVANEGTAFESFDVSCQYDSSVIGIGTVTLASGASATLLFVWNTAGVPNGVYVISAAASVVPGETNTANNKLVDGRVTVTRVPPPPELTLFVKFTPQTLNLNSKGKWITAQLKLVGTKYSAADVDTSTVLLNGTIGPVRSHSKGKGKSILELKFDRAAIINLIQSVKGIKSGYLILVITGQMRDGTSFMAFGMIRVRMPGDINCDGKVDMKDIGPVARRFNLQNYDTDDDGIISMKDIAFWAKAKKTSMPSISMQFGKTTDIGFYDVNEDGKIEMKDIGIVAANFGKTYH